MTAPLVSSILAVIFALAGYAGGRYHQWQRSAEDREDAYREGYDAATESTFSMAARIASPPKPAPMPTAPETQPTALNTPQEAPPTATPTTQAIPPTAIPLQQEEAPLTAIPTPRDAHPTALPTPREAPPTAQPTPREAPPAAPPTPRETPPAAPPTPREIPPTVTPTPALATTNMSMATANPANHQRTAARTPSLTQPAPAKATGPRASLSDDPTTRLGGGPQIGSPGANPGSRGADPGSRGAGFGGAGYGSHSGAALGRGLAADHAALSARERDSGVDFTDRDRSAELEEDDAGSLSRIADSAVGMSLGHRRMSQLGDEPSNGARHEGEKDQEENGLQHQGESSGGEDPAERSEAFFAPVVRGPGEAELEVDGEDAPRLGRRGRHYVPDELVRASTYRLPADRVARAKVPDTIRPPEDEEDGPRGHVPKPRSS
jgi:hypothetical protein